MSRFFKSAAFPILIVVVLAFFAQKLISPGEQTKKPDFSQFLTQIDNGQIKSALIKTKDNTVDVTKSDGPPSVDSTSDSDGRREADESRSDAMRSSSSGGASGR